MTTTPTPTATGTLHPTFICLPPDPEIKCKQLDWFGGLCLSDFVLVAIFVGLCILCALSSLWSLVLFCQRRKWRPYWHWYRTDIEKKGAVGDRGWLETLKKQINNKESRGALELDLKAPILECEKCGRLCNLDPDIFFDDDFSHFWKADRQSILGRAYFDQPDLPVCPCEMGFEARKFGPGLIRPGDVVSTKNDENNDDNDGNQGQEQSQGKAGSVVKQAIQSNKTKMLPLHWEQMLNIRIEQLIGAPRVCWGGLEAKEFQKQNVKPTVGNYVFLLTTVGGSFYNAFAVVHNWASEDGLVGNVKEHWRFFAKGQMWFEFILICFAVLMLFISLIYHGRQFRAAKHRLWLPLTLIVFLVDSVAWLSINSMYILPMVMNVPFLSSLIGVDRRWRKIRPLRLIDKQSIFADLTLFICSRPVALMVLLITVAAFVLKVYRLAISDFKRPIGDWGAGVWIQLIQFLLNIYTLMESSVKRNSPVGMLRGSIHLPGRTPFFHLLLTAPACREPSMDSALSLMYVTVLWIMLPPINLYMLFVWNAWYLVEDGSFEDSYESTDRGRVKWDNKELQKFISAFPSIGDHHKNWKTVSQSFQLSIQSIHFNALQSATVDLQQEIKEAVRHYFEHLDSLGECDDLLLLRSDLKNVKWSNDENEGGASRITYDLRAIFSNQKSSIGAAYLYRGKFHCTKRDCDIEDDMNDPEDDALITPKPFPVPAIEDRQPQCQDCIALQNKYGAGSEPFMEVLSYRDLSISVAAWVSKLPRTERLADLLDTGVLEKRFAEILNPLFGDGPGKRNPQKHISLERLRSAIGEHIRSFKRQENRAGYPVAYGTMDEYSDRVYCGRATKELYQSLTDWDGKCGPDGFRQCNDCKATTPSNLTRGAFVNGVLLVLAFYVRAIGKDFKDSVLRRDMIQTAFEWWLAERDHNLEMHTFIPIPLDQRGTKVCDQCGNYADYHCALDCDFDLCEKHFFNGKTGFYHMDGTPPFYPALGKNGDPNQNPHLFCGRGEKFADNDVLLSCGDPNPPVDKVQVPGKVQCSECQEAEVHEARITKNMNAAVTRVKSSEPRNDVPVKDPIFSPPLITGTPNPTPTPTYLIVDVIDA